MYVEFDLSRLLRGGEEVRRYLSPWIWESYSYVEVYEWYFLDILSSGSCREGGLDGM